MKQIFITALAAMAILTSCNQANVTSSQSSTTAELADSCAKQTSDMAYINVDLVLSQSELYVKEGTALQAKSQKAQESWARREKSFQSEASKLQEKYQKGLITTANAQKEQESIETRIKNYQSSAQKEAQQLEEENMVFTNRAQDLIVRAVKSINATGNYKMIVNASAVIDADSTLDISVQVLDEMNKIYASEL